MEIKTKKYDLTFKVAKAANRKMVIKEIKRKDEKLEQIIPNEKDRVA